MEFHNHPKIEERKRPTQKVSETKKLRSQEWQPPRITSGQKNSDFSRPSVQRAMRSSGSKISTSTTTKLSLQRPVRSSSSKITGTVSTGFSGQDQRRTVSFLNRRTQSSKATSESLFADMRTSTPVSKRHTDLEIEELFRGIN